MKKIGKYFKSDKGSITNVVLVTVLFFITIVSTAYMITATLRKSQLKSQIAVKETYEKDFNNIDEITDSLIRWWNYRWSENTKLLLLCGWYSR